MKKLKLLIIVLITSLSAFSQDFEWFDAQYSNTIPDSGEVMYMYKTASDTGIYRIRGRYANPIYRSGSSLYPRFTSDNFLIGSTTNPGSYKLYVNGTSLFNNNVGINGRLNFGAGYIQYSGGELVFYDATSGLQTLSGLIGGGGTSSISVRNGLTTSGGYYELGGSLIKTTALNTNGYTFNIDDDAYSCFSTNRNYSILHGLTRITVDAPDLTLKASDGFMIYSGDDHVEYTDYTATPVGLTMPDWAAYYENIKSDTTNEALVTYGMVRNMTDSVERGYINTDFLEVDSLYLGGLLITGNAFSNSISIGNEYYTATKFFSNYFPNYSYIRTDAINFNNRSTNSFGEDSIGAGSIWFANSTFYKYDGISTTELGSGGLSEPAAFTDTIYIGDTIRLGYLGMKGLEGWLLKSRTGGIGVDTLEAGAKRGLTDPLRPLHLVLADTVDGEISWTTIDKKGNQIHVRTFKNLSPKQVVYLLQYAIEQDRRYILELQEENAKLKERMNNLEDRIKILEKIAAQ